MPATPRLRANKAATKTTTKAAKGRPRQQDIAAIEENLLNVATAEFREHGYGAASLNRIVSAAGISKTTLYSRYASKAELFLAIVQQQITEMAPDSVLPPKSDLHEGLTAFANHILRKSLNDDMADINRLMFSESARFPELAAAAADRTARGIKRIAAFIDQCAEADGIPCRNPQRVAEVFILMVRGWYMNVLLTNQKGSATARKRWVDDAVNILLNSRQNW